MIFNKFKMKIDNLFEFQYFYYYYLSIYFILIYFLNFCGNIKKSIIKKEVISNHINQINSLITTINSENSFLEIHIYVENCTQLIFNNFSFSFLFPNDSIIQKKVLDFQVLIKENNCSLFLFKDEILDYFSINLSFNLISNSNIDFFYYIIKTRPLYYLFFIFYLKLLFTLVIIFYLFEFYFFHFFDVKKKLNKVQIKIVFLSVFNVFKNNLFIVNHFYNPKFNNLIINLIFYYLYWIYFYYLILELLNLPFYLFLFSILIFYYQYKFKKINNKEILPNLQHYHNELIIFLPLIIILIINFFKKDKSIRNLHFSYLLIFFLILFIFTIILIIFFHFSNIYFFIEIYPIIFSNSFSIFLIFFHFIILN